MSGKPETFTDFLRERSLTFVNRIAGFLMRLGITANMITLAGLVGNMVAAVFIGLGYIQLGGVIVLLMGPLDALDGAVARLRGITNRFGAFFDSVIDRYSELVILGGLMFYYIKQQDILACFVVYLAAAGSVLVSYIRSRAQGIGLEAKVGLLTRVERFIIMAICLLINQPLIALWIIAVLANVTAIQRIIHVYQQVYSKMK